MRVVYSKRLCPRKLLYRREEGGGVCVCVHACVCVCVCINARVGSRAVKDDEWWYERGLHGYGELNEAGI